MTEAKTVIIPCGAPDGHRIVFKGQGHEAPAVESSALVFVVREKPHPLFRREEQHLLLQVSCSLSDALTSTPVLIHTLRGRELALNFDEVINPRTVKVIAGEGMPALDSATKGDLIVSFKVAFPRILQYEAKLELQQLLEL